MKVMLVNHHNTEVCGVYKHGERTASILEKADYMDFVRVYCNNLSEYAREYEVHKPDISIYNYYPGPMSWAERNSSRFSGKHLGMYHEVTRGTLQSFNPAFDAWIVTDPSLDETPGHYVTVRPLFEYTGPFETPDVPTFGTFGFAFPNKGFSQVVSAVNEEFDEAVVRMHLTVAGYNGGYGEHYLAQVIEQCMAAATKPGIRLEVTRHFAPDEEILGMLAKNTANMLFYDHGHGRGLASTVDYCISVGRPLVTTVSEQFRHINPRLGSYPSEKIKQILGRGEGPVLDLKREWSPEQFRADYKRIIEKVVP